MKFCYHCMTQLKEETVKTCPNCGKSLKLENLDKNYLKPGSVLQSKFIVGMPIGAGGFGKTYIGWDKLLLRKVAIKEFYPKEYTVRNADGESVTVKDENHRVRFKKGLEQFLEEARNVAALQDIKGVVKITNFFEQNGTGYIIMEHLEGMDVREILKKSGNKKDYEWCRRVVLTVLHTLREIHKRGVLHRDIAPDNIFVTNEGVIKLIDFGAAKHASAFVDANAEIMLKQGYAPIEQYSNTTKQGEYTDLYATAALFYRMVTGQKLAPAPKRLEKDSLLPPSDLGIEISEQAELGMMVCLNIMPEYRLQSADEFMEALDGKDFVPVYEPEWILPPVKEPGMFDKFQKLSIDAKTILCVGSICIVVGLLVSSRILLRNDNIGSIEGKKLNSDEIILKDYEGSDIEVAKKELERLGVENVQEIYELNETIEEGEIMDQSEEANETIKKTTKIQFTVSGGENCYTLPDFTNWQKDEVIDFFVNQNFDVEVHEDPYDLTVYTRKAVDENRQKQAGKIIVETDFSDEVDKNLCYFQSVSSIDKMNGKDDVTIGVSMGKQSDYIKKIPDLSNMTKEEAEQAIKNAGLEKSVKLNFVDNAAYSNTYAKGMVMSQGIEAGEKINLIKEEKKPKKLKVSLSAGKKPVKKSVKKASPKKSSRKKSSHRKHKSKKHDAGAHLPVDSL